MSREKSIKRRRNVDEADHLLHRVEELDRARRRWRFLALAERERALRPEQEATTRHHALNAVPR